VAQAGWWQTPDQSGQAAFDHGDFADAAEAFESPQWRAAANYRANRYAEALADLPDDAAPDTLYNKGNALARLGRFEDAIAAYDKALAAAPEHADAEYNKALLEKLLAEQEAQQDQRSDADDKPKDQDGGGQSAGEQSSEQTTDEPADNESQSAADQQPGQDEQDAASSSSEQQSDAPPPAQEREQAAQEPAIAEQEVEASSADAAHAQANSEMENEQATEQWLRQIPDDPGGLLRRKFEYEYQKQYGAAAICASTPAQPFAYPWKCPSPASNLPACRAHRPSRSRPPCWFSTSPRNIRSP
jgi:Ca-activated chloride channel family protein